MIHTYGAEFASLDEAFLTAIRLILTDGRQSSPRALPTRELIPFSFSIADPRRRYISVPERRWSIAYAIGELAWHLRGSNSTEEIAFYAPRWRRIAAGKPTIEGSSYGAKMYRRPNGLLSQWDRALKLLQKDTDSRRAVIQLSSQDLDYLNPQADIACALSLQFLLRDGKLDAICTMRSNDVMLGLPYDVFLFTMIQEMTAVSLECELGRYYHQAGSMHLYTSQVEAANRVLSSQPRVSVPMTPMKSLDGMDALLRGEVRSRLGQNQVPTALEEDHYWSDLLEVIERWVTVRNESSLTGFKALRDPVLGALFAQWSSIEKLR